MSGELVPTASLAGTPAVDHVIDVLAELVEADPVRRFVLAGGLAVMARIGSLYRVTLDIDAVTADGIVLVEIIEDLDGSARQGTQLFVDGVKVDVLAIEDATRWEDIAGLDEWHGRLFNAGLLWAHQEAQPLTITSSTTKATVATATARSLLVTKLAAYHSPRRDPAKRPTDASGLYHLLERCAADVGSFHGDIPSPVVAVTRDALELLLGNIALFQTRLRSGPFGPDVPDGRLRALCDQVIEDLNRR